MRTHAFHHKLPGLDRGEPPKGIATSGPISREIVLAIERYRRLQGPSAAKVVFKVGRYFQSIRDPKRQKAVVGLVWNLSWSEGVFHEGLARGAFHFWYKILCYSTQAAKKSAEGYMAGFIESGRPSIEDLELCERPPQPKSLARRPRKNIASTLNALCANVNANGIDVDHMLGKVRTLEELSAFLKQTPALLDQWMKRNINAGEHVSSLYFSGTSLKTVCPGKKINGKVYFSKKPPQNRAPYVEIKLYPFGRYAGIHAGTNADVLLQIGIESGLFLPNPEDELKKLTSFDEMKQLASKDPLIISKILKTKYNSTEDKPADAYLVGSSRNTFQRGGIFKGQPSIELEKKPGCRYFHLRVENGEAILLNTDLIDPEILNQFLDTGIVKPSYLFRFEQLRKIEDLGGLLAGDPFFLSRLIQEQFGSATGYRHIYISGSNRTTIRNKELKGKLQLQLELPKFSEGVVVVQETFEKNKFKLMQVAQDPASQRLLNNLRFVIST